MINLLPQSEKELLFLGRVKKLVIILGSIFIVFLICLILVLLSVKFSIFAEVSSQKFLFQEAKKSYSSPDAERLKNAIQKYNNVLPSVLSVYQEDMHFSDILASISKIERPKGLRLTDISLNRQDNENKVKASISGASDTRENLVSFQKNLEKQPEIKNISFSPESWISPANVNFNLTLDFPKNGN